jgi:imidazolonepropionase-like amidohydrolase
MFRSLNRGSAVLAVSMVPAFVTSTLITAQGTPTSSVVAFRHVAVLDGTDASPRRDRSVIIRGNRIVSVGPASTRLPRVARVIDGRGKFLVPGFWDMHVHTVVPAGRAVLSLYIANGVTGVRDMAGDWLQLSEWRREISAGRLLGPRIVASGPYIEGGDVPIPHILARNPDEARAAVDSLARLGVDFIKLHSQMSREVYFAAARAAREKGIPFVGHVPRTVLAAEASDSGQRSLEHLLQIPAPCTPAESLALQPRFPIQAVLGRCTSEDLAPLFARFVRNGTWIVPTLTAGYEIALWPKRELPGDTLARYIPDTLRRFIAQIFEMPSDVPSDADVVGRVLYEKRLAVVGAMHRAGVGILPGTDAPLRNSPPGFGLHEELTLLVRAGLSPRAALRSATLEPARFFGMLDSLGTIAPGKVADLVLLDANPLVDIRNTRRVVAVVANGRLVDAKARQAILRDMVEMGRP